MENRITSIPIIWEDCQELESIIKLFFPSSLTELTKAISVTGVRNDMSKKLKQNKIGKEMSSKHPKELVESLDKIGMRLIYDRISGFQ